MGLNGELGLQPLQVKLYPYLQLVGAHLFVGFWIPLYGSLAGHWFVQSLGEKSRYRGGTHQDTKPHPKTPLGLYGDYTREVKTSLF